MRYTHLFHEIPSPSDAGLIVIKGSSKAKPTPLVLQKPSPSAQQQQQQPEKKVQSRLPNSQRHLVRKASISTGGSSNNKSQSQSQSHHPAGAVGRRHGPSEAKKLKAMPEHVEEVTVPIESPREMKAASKLMGGRGLPSKSNNNNNNNSKPSELSIMTAPRLKAWECYLHWLCLTEEPGTLWVSSLCATFHECLLPHNSPPARDARDAPTAAECAARVDDIYWSFYLPLDPLLQFLEDRILSGYLLHVWTMFVELGKRIPHDDPAQDRLVGLLKELVNLPPMEVRTWEGNNAPWSDLPTLDDALISGWDDLYDPEIQMSNPEAPWVNYFSFLGRLVAAGVTPDWWEIPAVTLQDVLAEEVTPTPLGRCKTTALAEFINHVGPAFFDWALDSGLLNQVGTEEKHDMSAIVPGLKRTQSCPVT